MASIPAELLFWVTCRFAPWKRDTQQIHLSDSAIVRSLLEKRRLSKEDRNPEAIIDTIIAAVDRGNLSETDGAWSAFAL
jgi:hypothetical protein